MNRLFHPDSPVMNVIVKIGSILIVNLVGVLLCIPVITAVPSFLAMYYALVKAVRADEGYSVKEYFHGLKLYFVRGLIAEVLLVLLGALLVFNRAYVPELKGWAAAAGVVLYDICLVFLGLLTVWVIPVLSRFTVSFGKYLKLLLSMAFRSLPFTIGAVILTAGAVLTVWWKPVTVLVVPGLYLYLVSFLTEPVLRKYMPPKEAQNDWYYRIPVTLGELLSPKTFPEESSEETQTEPDIK